MRDNDKNDALKKALDKTGLAEPVPDEAKKRIRKTKPRNFRKTLKKAGGYSLIFGSISYVFFTLKKYGFSVTIIRSALIWVISLLITAGAITTGIYFGARYLVMPGSIDRLEVPADTKPGEGAWPVDQKPAHENYAKPVSENLIGIRTFQGKDVSMDETRSVTGEIAKALGRYKDDKTEISFDQKGVRRAGHVILGSVEKDNNEYIINARLVRVSDAKIIVYTREKISSLDNLDRAGERIALRIISAIP